MESRLSDYKIIKLIGKGTFGTVFLGERDNIKYIIKSINLKIANITDVLVEVSALKKISKYNNCSEKRTNNSFMCLIDNFHIFEENKYIIVTNYLSDAITLRELINIHKKNNTTLDLSDIIFLMARLISQLEQMHNNGIIHGDIKPENIIVQYINDKIKNVIFIDFGASCSKQCLPKGTILYLAPELFRIIGYTNLEEILKLKEKTNDNFPINKHDYMKTDVFSLGIVFYEILNNKYPYPYLADYLREGLQEKAKLQLKSEPQLYNEESEIEILSKSQSEYQSSFSSNSDSDSDSDSDSFKHYQLLKNNVPKDVVTNNEIEQIVKLSKFYKNTEEIVSNYRGNYEATLNKIVESMLIINPGNRLSIHRIKKIFNRLTILLLTTNYYSLGKRDRLLSPSVENLLK